MDYRGQYAKDVCSDIAVITGYNFWGQYDELSEPNVIQLFFDAPNSTAFASLCKISNVLADSVASNVFAPSMDTVHRRDPSRIAAGVYLPYDGGSLYHYSYPTAYSYGFRDQVAPTASVKTASAASNLASLFLTEFDEQDESITTTIWMPPEQVNDIKAGHLIDVKLSHAPGFGDYRPCRVTSRTVRNWLTAEDLYEVELELSPTSAPYTGDVFSMYQRSEDYSGGYFMHTADAPAAGWWA